MSELSGSVQAIKNIKFSALSLSDKVLIKNRGPPRPDLDISQVAKSRGKEYVRKFSMDKYSEFSWLCGCKDTNAVYCFPCLLFGPEKSESAWTSTGITSLQKMSDKAAKHNVSKKHKDNAVALSMLGTTEIKQQMLSGYHQSIYRDLI